MSWIQIIGLIGALLLGVYNSYNAWQRDQEPDQVSSAAAVVFVAAFSGKQGKPEAGGGASKTEQAGYIPPKVQIERMILAGERLAASRKEEFDSELNGELIGDPTRVPGFDMADASRMAADVSERLRASQSVADAAKVVPEAAVEPPEAPVAPVPESLSATEKLLLEQLRKQGLSR